MPSRYTADAYGSIIASRRAILATQINNIMRPNGSLTCEIGAGHGHFLTAYASAHPDQVCVGIDIIGERVERANRKRDRAGLTQLHFLHAEARLFLETFPLETTISKIFILFPDPWPKKRHHKHRIIQPEFLTLLRSRVCSEAQLFFRTDHQPYFNYAHNAVSAHPQWRITDTAWPFEYETVFQQRADGYQSFSAEPRS